MDFYSRVFALLAGKNSFSRPFAFFAGIIPHSASKTTCIPASGKFIGMSRILMGDGPQIKR